MIVLQQPQSFAAWQAQKIHRRRTRQHEHQRSQRIPNLLEYALALAPKTAALSGRPVFGQQNVAVKKYLTVTFTKAPTIGDTRGISSG